MAEFAAMIKDAREQKGIRAYDLAFTLGMAPSWLSKLEAGNLTHPPAPHILEGLSESLSIPQPVMLAALGYKVGVTPFVPEPDPTDVHREFRSMISRLEMTPDKEVALRSLLRGWLTADAEARQAREDAKR